MCRGLSCYNNPNRLTGCAETEGGGRTVGVEGKRGPIGRFTEAAGGWA